MQRTERVAVEKHTERRILDSTMRQAPCQTRVPSPRQLPTDHDYAVSTREYQSDQPSQKLLDRLLALSLSGYPGRRSANQGCRSFPFPSPSYASFAERSSPSRVRCAAPYPRAPLTAPVRSADASCLRRKGEERKTNTKTNIVRFST